MRQFDNLVHVISTMTGTPLVTPVARLKRNEQLTFGGTMRGFGSAAPTVTLTGTLLFATACPAILVAIDSTAGGTARGQATFKVSYNGGASYAHSGVTTAATYALDGAASGVTLNFPVGTYDISQSWKPVVTQWKSTNGLYTWSQATFASMPTYDGLLVDGANGMDFDGAAYELTGTDAAVNTVFADSKAYTLIIKGSTDVAAAIRVAFGAANSGQAANGSKRFGTNSTAPGKMTYVHTNDAAASVVANATGNADTADHIWAWRTGGSAGAKTISLSQDGAANDPNGTAAQAGTLTPNRTSIGCRPSSTKSTFWDGQLSDIVIFDVELTDPQLAAWIVELD